MFNISFGEIFIIVAAGLIVIGPQKLPETARFLGHLLSRIQRQVAGVKADIRREMELEDLKKVQREYESAVRGAGAEIKGEFDNIRNEATEAADKAKAAVNSEIEESGPTKKADWPSPPESDSKDNEKPERSEDPPAAKPAAGKDSPPDNS